MANEENNAILGLSFPQEALRIVEDAASPLCTGTMREIQWSLRQISSRWRYQRRGTDQIFETDSIKSFIRLN